MEDRKMEIIQQLMDELQEMMKPSGDELGERLGRPKQVDVMKISAGAPGMEGEDPMDDDSMGPDEDDMQASPDDMLKRRLMKLRE